MLHTAAEGILCHSVQILARQTQCDLSRMGETGFIGYTADQSVRIAR